MGFKDRVGGGGLDAMPGFMIRMPGMPHRTQLASWDKDTRLRVFPMPLGDGGWQPMRNSVENDDFGDAVTVEPCCRKLGVHEQFTVITRIPDHDGEPPINKFCKSMVSTAENSPHDLPREWCEWTKGARGRAPKIAKVQNCIFFQCAMLTINGEECINRQTGRPAPKYPALFMGSVSMLMTFSRLGNTLVENYNGPRPSSVAAQGEEGRKQLDRIYKDMFQIGDWCSPEGGRVMRVFQVPATQEMKPHYGIEMQEEMPLGPIEHRAREVWKPWDQLLRYHTVEEQIGYLCRAFPIEAVDFTLGRSEYEGVLPTHVRGSWQRLQQQMVGAWSPGIPNAAQQQMGGQPPMRMPGAGQSRQMPQQPQQPTPPISMSPQPQHPQQPTPPARTSAWGDGGGDSFDDQPQYPTNSPAGPAVPQTPAAFSGQTNTPAASAESGAVDPSELANTLNMLRQAQDQNSQQGS